MLKTMGIETTFESSDTEASAHFLLPADLIWFQGHFPKQPLLPGVTQLQWVMDVAQKWLGPLHLDEIVSCKFIHPILPEKKLELRLTKQESGNSLLLHYEYRILTSNGKSPASLGKLRCSK